MITKKKVILIILGMLVIVAVILVFLNRDWILKPKKSSIVEDQKKIEIKDKVVMDSGTVLDYEIFFLEKINLNDVKITLINQDETVSDRNLILNENIVYSIGIYDVTIELDGEIYHSILEVVDKTPPVLEVKDVEITLGDEITSDDFIVHCEDNSNAACMITITDLEGNTVELDTTVGTKEYIIVARDNALNEVKKKVHLTVQNKEINETPNQAVSTNNNSNPKEETNNNPPQPVITVVSTKNETEEAYEDGKYGTKYKVTNIYTITTYSNATTDKKLISSNRELDTSGFQATSKELESEARNVSTSSYALYEEVTKYVNEYRVEVSTEPLTLNRELSVLATIRAIEMAYADTFRHTRPDGRSWSSVGDDMGFERMIFAENIAYGTGGYNGTPQKVATSWKNSPGHYNNMIASGHRTIGVGTYTLNGKTYWVQLFCG